MKMTLGTLAAALLIPVLSCSRGANRPAAPHHLGGSSIKDDVRLTAPLEGASEIEVELAPGVDLTTELQSVVADSKEDLDWNSAEGPSSGVAIDELAEGQSMAEALARLRQDPRVKVAEPVTRVHADLVPNDPQYQAQWNLKKIHMEDAWDVAQGEGVVVAVIDTGIAYEDRGEFRQVPDLKGIKFAPGYDFVHDTDHPNDDNGHGTHVAGTIAQATDNGEGVAGIAYKATLMPIKVLDASGTGTSADIADAIHWAADHGARVINMSLGGGGPSQIMADAVAYARHHGVVVVCAAGNAGRATVEFPAAYPGAVAVSAIRADGQLAPYSSWGKEIDIAAPGGDKSADPTGGILQNTIDPNDPSKSVYAWYQGTSMATPHVAGVAALLFSAGAKTPDEVEAALFAGAEAGGTHWNDRTGHGILDARASLQALQGKLGGATLVPAEMAWAEGASQASPWTSVAKVVLGLLMAIGVAATIRRRQRNPLGPALLVALTMSAAGIFFLPRPETSSMGAMALRMIELPIPDWGRWIFGPGRASPLFYSAAIPLALSMLGYAWQSSRQVIGGVCFGFAAFMAYAIWSGAPAIAWMPLRVIAIPWLLVNVGMCLFLARAMIRKPEAA